MFVADATAPFGLLGIVIVIGFLIWLARSRSSTVTRECPYCKKRMRGDASVCPHCQRESTPWKLHEGRWWRQDESGGWEYLVPPGQGGPIWKKGAAATTASEENASTSEP